MGVIAGNGDVGARAEPPGRSLAPIRSHLLLLTSLLSPIRLQKEVKLAQKADYLAQRAASPLPYDKISVRCPCPSLQGVWCWVQACSLLEGFPARRRTLQPGWGALQPSPTLSLLSPQPGDKTLAQSAQMYHYQHQKQQMLSMEK